ncbi:MAG: hypothetical protein ACLUVV_07400 [Christensenellales bacterium]
MNYIEQLNAFFIKKEQDILWQRLHFDLGWLTISLAYGLPRLLQADGLRN